ncbi:uncharacterized protein [Miscanthus floridulus]|uniref:uncharacterized protein n=1 Tax=Miscanthus floridulus TaxID=154761 RepID=UPI00345B1E58
MEVLNRFLKWVEQQQLLTPLHDSVGNRTSLYVDDLVLFVVPNVRDLQVIKAVLTIFGLASGLFSNLDKSVASPLHCSENDIAKVRDILSCRIEDLPCRYLGAPLSVRRLKRSDEQPLIDEVAARIPKWKGNMLNVAGRTTLVKATMSAIPTHMSIVLCLSPWAIESIDKLRRAFIWCGSDKVLGGKCKVAWETVCRPRDLGGLDVSDLRRAGIALQAAIVFMLGNGESTFFWTDRWLDGRNIEDAAPAVFAAVKARKRRATIAEALHNNAWIRHITGPLTMQGTETMNHILLGCPFSREVWEAWFRKLHLQYTVVVQDEPAIPWWLRCRKALSKQLHRGFDSLFFLIGWSIWKERNARTFNGVSTSAARLEVSIQEEADAWCMAGYKHLGALMASI